MIIMISPSGQKKYVCNSFVEHYKSAGYVVEGEEEAVVTASSDETSDATASSDETSDDTPDASETTDKKIICEVCGKECASEAGLKKHMSTHNK